MTVWFEKGRGAARKKIGGAWVTGGYRFDFWLFNDRHTSPRGWDTEQEALDAEAALRRALRRQRAGLEPLERPISPTFAETAGAYYAFAEERDLVDDLATLDRMHRVILQFFGPRPADPALVRPGAPYHDLRLQAPIDDPTWVLKFEQWMQRRPVQKRKGLKGATKNRYRSAVSRLYWFAMLPERRQVSGITSNPFRGLLRDRERARDVVLTPAQLKAILACAPYHLRLAIVIAALAPKLRMSNILGLKWKTSFDPAFTTIRVSQHKTARTTGRPMIAPISAQLQRILLGAKARQPAKVPWVIHYRGTPLKRLISSLTQACTDAGIPYGRANNGPTFHTIRHTAATLLAGLGVPEGLRKDVMGHLSIQTTQGYTHLNPMHERAPLERLSGELALEDLVTAPRRLSGGTPGGTLAPNRHRTRPKGARRKSSPPQRRKAHKR
jgi:integrase